MRSNSKRYINLSGLQNDRENTPWYWRFIALAASWMILGGYVLSSWANCAMAFN